MPSAYLCFPHLHNLSKRTIRHNGFPFHFGRALCLRARLLLYANAYHDSFSSLVIWMLSQVKQKTSFPALVSECFLKHLLVALDKRIHQFNITKYSCTKCSVHALDPSSNFTVPTQPIMTGTHTPKSCWFNINLSFLTYPANPL